MGKPEMVTRLPISDSLPQISELAAFVLANLKIPNPMSIRDGVTGYPLQDDLELVHAGPGEFDLWQAQAQASNVPPEVSSGYNLGQGMMRIHSSTPVMACMVRQEERMVAGMAYLYDEKDRCVRIIDSFAVDEYSMGALFFGLVKHAQEKLFALYLEIDIIMKAPRLLKTAEQLGFVPVAYMPAFFFREGKCTDVVKLVKLNLAYSLENVNLGGQARSIVDIVDHNFQDQKTGVAIINLLRGLGIFDGLGDGELHKITRLFSQKLYRPGEKVFNRGDTGTAAYVVMRGQVDIVLEERVKPVASMLTGHIFGEQAFLESTTRIASAVAVQPTILLVIQRTAFHRLIQLEPHLGMTVMRNVAVELSHKLKQANAAILVARHSP
jgi:hypothetical protein